MVINRIKYRSAYYGLVILFLIGLIGCNDFNELNTPDDQILTTDLNKNTLGKTFAQAEYWGYLLDPDSFQREENLYSDLYAQYFATSVKYFSSDQFNYVPAWVQYGWDKFYIKAAPNLKLVKDFTADNDMNAENAVAKVWEVAIYARMTDIFGPIIYSQFGNSKKSVAYDSQKDIYMNFFKKLDEAVAVLQQNTGSSVFPSNDLIFDNEGNVDDWLSFANSLRLRLAMRIVYVDPAKAKKEAEKAIVAPGGVIKDNSANVAIYTTAQSKNPHTQISQYGEYRMSAALVSALKGYNDPRLSAYMNEATDGGGYHGLRNGIPVTERGKNVNQYSFVDTKLLPIQQGGTSPPWPVMDASEIYFLRAEGALRGWDMDGTTNQLYNMGIRVSLENKTNATSSEISTYVTSTNKPTALNDKWNSPPVFNIPVKFQSGANFETKLEQIISQKWLALYPDGWEAWSERRRTNYPKLYPLIKSDDSEIPKDAIIRRMKFSADEVLNNSEAVKDAVNLLRTSKDERMTRVWWDAKGL